MFNFPSPGHKNPLAFRHFGGRRHALPLPLRQRRAGGQERVQPQRAHQHQPAHPDAARLPLPRGPGAALRPHGRHRAAAAGLLKGK